MDLLERQMITLFPTQLFTGKLSDLSLCDRVEEKLRELRKVGQGTQHNKYTFSTHDDIHSLPEMKELADLVMQEGQKIFDVYKIKRASHYISNMWANITHPNHRHPLHIHPNCLFSGILYIKTPENCGPTVFHDPRPQARMIEPAYSEMNSFNSGMFTAPAEKGRMLIWPSYLWHAVEYGNTAKEDDERIVVAFNFMMRGQIARETARLELK
jgi:uncharacterized protein (TIGR02466 family)